MAHLLGKLGKEAIKPILSKNGVWHKPAISAKNLARLRKESLLAGRYVSYYTKMPPNFVYILYLYCRDWEFDAEPKPEAKPRKLKGHKHDKLKAQRYYIVQTLIALAGLQIFALISKTDGRRELNILVCFFECRQQDIADKLVGMDAAIEKHRVSRRNIDVPLLDRLLLTPKQQRLKARGV